MSKWLMVSYIVLALCFGLYSYGFVDFNLTLSSHPLVSSAVGALQQLALFSRPLSVNVYLGFLLIFFGLYLLTFLTTPSRAVLPTRFLLLLALLFALSYPLLSSDVFKYLFSAKTVIVYHQNPHQVAPQVFEGDLWLRFMRWIHTPSPYGPVQTLLAIPPYLAGFGKFVPTLYLYKLIQVAWYGLALWSLARLGASSRWLLFFALNPLVLIEWLVNAHNDAPLLALALFSLALLKPPARKALAFFSLLLSIGTKFVTLIFLPVFLVSSHIRSRYLVLYALTLLTLAPLLYHYDVQYQPWYVTWLVPFAALRASPLLAWTVSAYTLGALLRYLPYIETGLWQGTPLTFGLLTFLPPVLTALVYNGIYAARTYTQKIALALPHHPRRSLSRPHAH